MATTFSLDDIRAAAEREYGNKTLDLGDAGEVVLVNPLRLSKKDRDALRDLQDRDDADDADPIDFFVDAFGLVTKDKGGAERIKKAFGEDVALYMATFQLYMKESELGEASPSQD